MNEYFQLWNFELKSFQRDDLKTLLNQQIKPANNSIRKDK